MNKFLIICCLFLACKKTNVNQDPIPDVPVNITINMALPSYSHLFNPGSHVFEDGGVKGIVVVHHLDDEYYAFDRTCAFQPNSDCSKIEVDSSVLVFRCGKSTLKGFEKCCESRYMMDGQVLDGPTTFGLRRYQLVKSGNLLSIQN